MADMQVFLYLDVEQKASFASEEDNESSWAQPYSKALGTMLTGKADPKDAAK